MRAYENYCLKISLNKNRRRQIEKIIGEKIV